jgi:transcriptional regulator with XRE-family HTH domain
MALGYNQRKLARLLDWTPSTLSHYERGRYNQSMTFARLRQVARTLATSTDYLLGLTNDPGPIPEEHALIEGHSLDGTTPLQGTTPMKEHGYAKYTTPRP